ncbi:hypothetical protein AM2_0610 [Lactococcus cremoris]|uniref:Uncharacterized protein n=1 Tax=Lactococcus cremoris subsp. tructae TaxID=542833 RepID=A0A2A5STQ6_LACLC|nr:hypothetical protein llh_11775 [Lactococcus cremoris subsp. cremoris A76]KZK12475.1 hypothetical protein AB995_1049 [Lactococcus cremoris]PCS18881.1 hypothetical protein RU92_GL002073 [Lactococcus cremoris subsp. tructae]KZK34992.1 hypothetical protein LMG6897_2157 [Lactococcus cremoris]KZK38455.1 hypothetical protein N41_1366 [Lactococcus cremoris]
MIKFSVSYFYSSATDRNFPSFLTVKIFYLFKSHALKDAQNN